MSTKSNPILVGVDGSTGASRALEWAAAEATGSESPLRLIHAVVASGMYTSTTPPADLANELRQRGEGVLRQARDRLSQLAPGIAVETRVEVATAPALLLAEANAAAMIVIGSRGRSRLAELFTGSTAIAVSAHAPCPVAVVHPDLELPAQGPVVVGVDGSPTSTAAIRVAFEEASRRGVALEAVHTWSDAEARDQVLDLQHATSESVSDAQHRVLTSSLSRWRQRYPDVKVHERVFHDRPRHVLVEQGRRAQLLVLGSRGRGGFTGMMLGSVSQALIHHAPCPLLIVRPGAGE